MMIEEVIKCIEANVGCLELDKSNGRVLYGSEEKFIEAGHYAIESMKELLEYKKLGTLEEVEDAMEKQTAEKPMKVLGINGNIEYECGYCGESEAINEMFTYCPWCGQKIDFGKDEENE